MNLRQLPGRAGDRVILSLWQRLLEWQQLSRAANAPAHDWTTLLADEVVPVLGWPEGGYKVSARPPGMSDSAPFRERPHVRFVTRNDDSGETVVVRTRRRWRLFPKRALRMRGVSSAPRNGLMLRHLGIPVPALVWYREASSLFGLRDHYVSVEGFVPGRALDCGNGDDVAAAMRLLARMHGHTGSLPGMPGRYRVTRERFIREHVRYVVLRGLGGGGSGDGGHSLSERRDLLTRVESVAREAYLEQRQPLRLIHGDINEGNFLVADSGEVVLLDLDSLRFDLVAAEPLRAAARLGGGDVAMAAHAWTSYFEAAGEERWQEFLSGARLGLLLHLLRRPGKACPARLVVAVAEGDIAPWGATPADTDWKQLLEL